MDHYFVDQAWSGTQEDKYLRQNREHTFYNPSHERQKLNSLWNNYFLGILQLKSTNFRNKKGVSCWICLDCVFVRFGLFWSLSFFARKEIIEREQIAAASPIEQRWTSRQWVWKTNDLLTWLFLAIVFHYDGLWFFVGIFMHFPKNTHTWDVCFWSNWLLSLLFHCEEPQSDESCIFNQGARFP